MSMLSQIIYFESLWESKYNRNRISSRESYRWNEYEKIPKKALFYVYYDMDVHFIPYPPYKEMDLSFFIRRLKWFVKFGEGDINAKAFADELLKDTIEKHRKGKVIKYQLRPNKFTLTLE
jgi:hypothetical protein